ncbi:MAG: hypothetical protein AABX52_03900 [Nanoarchaeota archaeon]
MDTDQNKPQQETHSTTPTSHQERELRRKQREEEREAQHQTILSKKRNKQIIYWSIGVLLIVSIIFIFYKATNNLEKPLTASEIHWHADVDIQLCGIHKDLPRVPQGAGHFGTVLAHTHDDNKLHLEGQIFRKKDALVGTFLEAIGVEFNEVELYGKRAGDLCNGKPGSIHSFINEKSVLVQELKEYVIKDGDKIKLSFE